MACGCRRGLPTGRSGGLQLQLKLGSPGVVLERSGLDPRDVSERDVVALLGRGEHGDRVCRVGH